MTGLEVWLDEHEVGWLRPSTGWRQDEAPRVSLAYLERWTSEVLAFPLAPSLPMPERGGPRIESETDEVQAFFGNLLPEAPQSEALFSALGLARGDRFGALRRAGHDLAGAVRLVPVERERPPGPVQRPVSPEELSERLRHRDALPFAVWDGQVRGLLSGSRDKLCVYVEPDGGWHLVDGPQMASTHVLKPAPVDPALRDLPFNELFCMRLAALVGLDVAPVQLHQVPEPVLIIERFDRQRLVDGRVRRLHTIDACQALGLPHRNVSPAQLFSLLKHSPTPLVDARALLRWTAFQQLLGNGSGDGRNVSFFVDHGGLRVAPVHTLASAAATGAAPQPPFSTDDWATFAHECDVAPRSIALELKRMGEAVREQAPALAEELRDVVPHHVLEAALAEVLAACERQVDLR